MLHYSLNILLSTSMIQCKSSEAKFLLSYMYGRLISKSFPLQNKNKKFASDVILIE